MIYSSHSWFIQHLTILNSSSPQWTHTTYCKTRCLHCSSEKWNIQKVNDFLSWIWWLMPVIPIVRTLKQEDCHLFCLRSAWTTVRWCLKTVTTTTTEKKIKWLPVPKNKEIKWLPVPSGKLALGPAMWQKLPICSLEAEGAETMDEQRWTIQIKRQHSREPTCLLRDKEKPRDPSILSRLVSTIPEVT